MKKFKISFVAIFAIVLGIAGSAFTLKPQVKKVDSYFYQFNSNSSTDLMDEENWTPVDSRSESCSSTPDLSCVIHLQYEPDVEGHPDFVLEGIDDPEDFENITDSWKPEVKP